MILEQVQPGPLDLPDDQLAAAVDVGVGAPLPAVVEVDEFLAGAAAGPPGVAGDTIISLDTPEEYPPGGSNV